MPVNKKVPLRLFHNGEQITDAAILATHSTEGKSSSTKHFVLINGAKTEVRTANQLSRQRLFHQDEEITDEAILATHSKEGKWGRTKHFVVINGVKTEVRTADQLFRNRLFHQGREITDEAIIATHSKEAQGGRSKHFVVVNGVKTEVMTADQRAELESVTTTQSTDGLPEAQQTQLTQEVAQSNGDVNQPSLKTPGQRNALTEFYDEIFSELEDFITTQSTGLPEAGQPRLMQEVAQSNSLRGSAHTLFKPQNQPANRYSMWPSAGESRLQKDDLVPRGLKDYHVLEQILFDNDREFDTDERFTY